MRDRDYDKSIQSDIRADLPDYDSISEHGFDAYAQSFDTGAYIVITDTGGMDYPTATDFLVCVYRSEDAFGDDPTSALLAEFSSDDYADLLDVIALAEFVAEFPA